MKEFYESQQFREYLLSLDTEKPFDCPILRVLPEDVYNDEAKETYEKGALICSATPGSMGDILRTHRCHLSHLPQMDLILNEAGELEFKCGWNRSKFKLVLKDFEPCKK